MPKNHNDPYPDPDPDPDPNLFVMNSEMYFTERIIDNSRVDSFRIYDIIRDFPKGSKILAENGKTYISAIDYKKSNPASNHSALMVDDIEIKDVPIHKIIGIFIPYT